MLSSLSFLLDPLALALYAGACLGHAVLMLASINYLYGCPLPRKVLSITRKFDGLVVLAGPVLFAWIFAQTPDALSLVRFEGHPVACAYLWLCWLLGLIAFPLLTLQRLLRRMPAGLLQNHSAVFDVAKHLGYKPVGTGKHRRAAALPFNQCFEVEFKELTLRLPHVPAAWDGLKILHLTDLHFCGTPAREFYDLVMERCRAWEPDVLALTGDIVDSNKHHRWIVRHLGRLRWKAAAFAVLGNHDFWHEPELTRRRLRRLGIQVLGNGWTSVEVRGEKLVVVGNERPWGTADADLSGLPSEGFRLCLSHTPDNIAWARKLNVDLLLAGHVHGGQIRLPVIGSIFVPSKYSRRYDCGTFDESPTVMHVGRGLAGQHPLRFLCRPEVTFITLRAE